VKGVGVSRELQRPATQRAATLGAVILLHLAFVALLVTQSGAMVYLVRPEMLTRVIPSSTPKPPKPPEIKPQLPPILMPVPIPEVNLPPPPTQSSAPRAIIRVGPPVAHFGAANGDAGLGLDVATTSGGGVRGRGSLGDFEAAVKRAVLRRKVQPALAWDRRNTCVINYTVSVARDGSLAGLSIDACAIPEINDAARNAIREAAPFPPPPDLGAATYDVHGTLIFHP
jgi:protein TonB